jgi:hypothetical protein
MVAGGPQCANLFTAKTGSFHWGGQGCRMADLRDHAAQRAASKAAEATGAQIQGTSLQNGTPLPPKPPAQDSPAHAS